MVPVGADFALEPVGLPRPRGEGPLAVSRGYQKRGGGVAKLTLDEALIGPREKHQDLVALNCALNALADNDARKSRVVELRFFAGLSIEETAEALRVSRTTVNRDWVTARAWLMRELSQR